MKMTIKRVLALVMALAMALPSFALSEDGGRDLPYVEEALNSSMLAAEGDADVADAGTPDEAEEITLDPEDGIVIAEAEETPIEAKEMTLDLDEEADAADAETPKDANETPIDPEGADEALIDADTAVPEGFVCVSVAVTPEDAAVAIFDIDGETPVEPQLGADWLLAPGAYAYSAWAEGFIAAERVAFEVPEAESAFELEIALRPGEATETEETSETENTTDIEDVTETGETSETEDATDIEGVTETDEPEEGIIDEAAEADPEDPEEEPTDEPVEADPEEADEAANEETEEAQPVPFSESKTVDGVVVTVEAEAGAFPAGAVLNVRKVPMATCAEADAAVEEIRADDVNVAKSYTFDIKVLDAEGNELQPAEGFAVAVSFALAQVADANLETSVYHITEDDAGELTADRLDAVEDAAARTVTAETEGFSLYTVEFTYNALQYVLEGGDSVPLSAILSAVGLTGEAESAAVSDEGLLSVAERDGELVLQSHNPFLTEEWLRVTIGGVAFEIAVTDANAVPTSYTVNDKNVGVTATAVSYDDTELCEETSKWYVVNENVELSERLTITGDVNLILCDGVTLTAVKGICLSKGNRLTVYGQAGGTGALVVPPKDMDMEQAGIGGNRQQSAGAFTLYGGTVTVTGGADGAGIGGGDSGSGGDVTIYGGTLTAQGGLCGAGIGGGLSGSQYGRFVMYDGTVTATGGNYGAGIGGGENFNDEFGDSAYGGNGGQVSVWGGTLIVTGGKLAAAIGGGKRGSGGSLQVGGSAEIIATAGAKNKRDNAIQAIGRGQVSTRYVGQSEGSVVLADEAGVEAGDDASSASPIAIYRRAEGCRMPYAHIESNGTLSYAIGTQINQVLEDRVTDTIYVQNLSGKSIAQAEAGETFRAIVILDDESTFVSLTATYTLGGEAQTLKPDSQTQNGDVVTGIFTMPSAVDGIVTVRAQVERKTYAITLPKNVDHGSVSVVGDQDGEVTRVTDGTRVRLSTIVDADSLNYFIQEIKVTGATSQKVYASLVNDTTTNMTMGDSEDEWLFKMPKEDVVITANFAEGCWYTNLNGVRKVRRYFNTITSENDLNLNGHGVAAGWYIVPANTTVTITNRIDITAEVNIILCDGATLNANDGIFVAQRKHARLTIWAQSGSGAIYADATGSSWAGIGGNTDDDTGPITINGGHIEAQGGHYAAGISGGKHSETNTVTINVPKGKDDRFTYVKATGGKYGAGIGGGEDRNNDKCVINGGTVYAEGGEHGAGIGGGEGGGSNNIEINGGYVYAKGGELAAGLGGGEHYRGGGFGGTVVINDGEVYAYGGRNGAGIGGGEDGSAATVTVNGGYLYAEGGEYAAGIGGGENEPGGDFTMNGGEVEAYGGKEAAGIGGAEDEKGGTVIINGGKLLAGGGTDVNCAIGGGKGESDNGSLTIADGMSVEYGSNIDSLARAEYNYRKTFAQWSKYARIDTCPHPGTKGYEAIDENQHYTPSCKYCSPGKKAEDHVWRSDGLVCTRCGYNKIHALQINKNGSNPNTSLSDWMTVEVLAGGEVVGNISEVGDYWLGNVCEGRSVTVKITPKPGHEFAGDAYVPVANKVTISQTDDAETGARTVTFTMPCGDMSLTCPMGLASLKAYFNYSAAMGSVTSYGMTDNIAIGWMGQTRSFTVEPKNENYTIRSVVVCKRNDDGTDGDELALAPSTLSGVHHYTFSFPETDVNVNILFDRAGTVDVYHVVQTFNANGSPIWPQDAPEVVVEQATREFYSDYYPSVDVLEDGRNVESYTCVGYKWDIYSAAATGYTAEVPRYPNPLPITSEHSALYVYYTANNYTLNIYNSGTFNDGNKRESLSVPIGTPLLAYLAAKGYDPGENSDGNAMKWATGESGKRSYTLLTAETTMPSAEFNIYPVYADEYVHVLIDVGAGAGSDEPHAYDWHANEDPSVQGEFWVSSTPTLDNYKWPGDESNGVASNLVYMDEHVLRSLRVPVGEPLPESVAKAMQTAIRPGWRLKGWKVVFDGSTGKEAADWNPGHGMDEEYFFNNADRLYSTSDAYNNKKYHYVKLVAQWEMRDALVIFDAAGGAWSKGDTYRTATIPAKANESTTVSTLLDNDFPTRNNGGWAVSKWILGKTVTKIIYDPLPNPTLSYYDFRLVADGDLAKTTDPDAKNVIRLIAEYTEKDGAYCNTYFKSVEDGEDVIRHTSTNSLPKGEGIVNLRVVVGGDTTRVYDTAGTQTDVFYNPTRDGYAFLGWRDAEGGEAKTVLDVTHVRAMKGRGDSSESLYAVWKEQPHNLILDLAGGHWPDGQYIPLSYECGEKILRDKLVPIREHYDFTGWQTEDDSDLPETMPHADVTATAQWEPHEYTLTFINVGIEYHSISAIMGEDIQSLWPDNPEREGYAFTGWYPGNPPETMPGYDDTYIAKWELIPEKPGKPVLKIVNSATLAVVDPDDDLLYSIDGGRTWVSPDANVLTFENLTPGTTYQVIAKVAAVPGVSQESEVSQPAKAKMPRSVLVRLNVGGYDLVADTEADAERVEKLNLWENYPIGEDTETPVDLTWEQSRQFTKGEGDPIELDRLANATRTGYALAGWYNQRGVQVETGKPLDVIQVNFDKLDPEPKGTPGDPCMLTLTARWTPRKADVVYEADAWVGDAQPTASTVEFGGTAPITDAVPVAEGKDFVCWENAKTGAIYNPGEALFYDSIGAVTAYGGDAGENNTITLKPVFINKPATKSALVFDSQGGSAVEPFAAQIEECEETAKVTISRPANGEFTVNDRTYSVPAKQGYTFKGWYEDANCTAEATTVTVNRDGPTTVYAKWDVNKYTITFDTNGGSEVEPASIKYEYGEAIDSSNWPKPDRQHHDFDRWEPVYKTMPAGNLTVEAVWTPREYTVTFKNDDDVWNIITGVYGAKLTPPADPAKDGEVFKGWHTQKQGEDGETETLPVFMPDTNPIYYAVWKAALPPDAPKLVPGVGSLSVAEPDPAMEYQCVDADALADEAQYGDWQSPTDGAMTFDGLKEGHLYYVRARYEAAAGITLPSDWTAKQTYKTTITGVEIVGEPVVGNTLVAHVTPERMNGDVYYIWTRNGATASVQCLKEAADSYDALSDEIEIVSEASYALTEADVGATIKVYAWQFGVPGLIGVAIKPSEAVEVVKREDEHAPEEPEPVTPAQSEASEPTATPAPVELEPAAPAAPAVADASAMLIVTTRSVGRNALRATWTEIPGADGYDVFYALCGKNTYKLAGTVAGGAKRALRIRNLKVRRSYKVIVKAYVLSGGEKTYVAQSPTAHCYTHGGSARIVNPGSLKLKKAALTLKLGRTGRISATVKGVRRTGRLLNHARRLRFYSSDPAVATVNKSGVVKAVGQGSCLIYVLTNNGIWKTVNVTVND